MFHRASLLLLALGLLITVAVGALVATKPAAAHGSCGENDDAWRTGGSSGVDMDGDTVVKEWERNWQFQGWSETWCEQTVNTIGATVLLNDIRIADGRTTIAAFGWAVWSYTDWVAVTKRPGIALNHCINSVGGHGYYDRHVGNDHARIWIAPGWLICRLPGGVWWP